MSNPRREDSAIPVQVFTPEFLEYATDEFQAALVRDAELGCTRQTQDALDLIEDGQSLTPDTAGKILFALGWAQSHSLDLEGNLREHQRVLVERFEECGEDDMSFYDARLAKRWSALRVPAFYRDMPADVVAETVNYWKHLEGLEDGCGMRLYSKLWDFHNRATDPTPEGGDGSNGTVECPQDVTPGNDTGSHWWGVLDDDEKEALVSARGE